MRILLVAYYNPLGEGGDQKQVRGLFQALIEQGHQIGCLTVASPKEKDSLRSSLEESGLFSLGCVVLLHCENPYTLLSKIRFWFSAKPAQFLASQSPNLLQDFCTNLISLCKNSQIDTIHCLGIRTAYFLPEHPPASLVLDLVDSITQHKRRLIQFQFRYGFNPFKILILALDYLKTRRVERDVLLRFSKISPVATVSPFDKQTLKELCPSAEISVVCHPVTVKLPPEKIKDDLKHQGSLVFYGVMDLPWNSDALNFLIHEIIPIVHKTHPELKLSITGFKLSPRIYNLSERFKWINVIPTVEDISEFISTATITCWPFRCGSGVKNKILESMIAGKPIVTTTLGAEPFTDTQRRGILVANKAGDIADKIVFLLNSPDERLRLGNINREIVLKEFTWQKKAQQYLDLYSLSLQKRATSI